MKYIVFNRETNQFDDILTDPAIKRKYATKIRYTGHLILGFPAKDAEMTISFILLKYGNCASGYSSLSSDRAPVAYKDYVPKRK